MIDFKEVGNRGAKLFWRDRKHDAADEAAPNRHHLRREAMVDGERMVSRCRRAVRVSEGQMLERR
jgi:hypothetical protein